MNAAWENVQASAPGRTVSTVRTTAHQAYNAVLKEPGPAATWAAGTGTPVAGKWSDGPVDYQRTPTGALAPRQVVNRRRSGIRAAWLRSPWTTRTTSTGR